MPSKFAKIQKHVIKKKGTAKATALHESSRDAQRLGKARVRDDRVARLHQVHKNANKQWNNRALFMKENLPETLHPMDITSIQALVQQYLDRTGEELEELKAERRAGRPPSTRQTLLEQARELERREYESGFWMPDLRDEETLVKLDAWGGDWLGLGNLRFMRVDVNGSAKEAPFPPGRSS